MDEEVLTDASTPGPTSTIVVGHLDGVTVLTLLGEHDMSTADKLAATIDEHAAVGRGIVIALSETDFIDSRIVYQLFRGDRTMITHGRRLVIQNHADAVVDAVLRISRAYEQLLCADTLDEAVEFARQRYREH